MPHWHKCAVLLTPHIRLAACRHPLRGSAASGNCGRPNDQKARIRLGSGPQPTNYLLLIKLLAHRTKRAACAWTIMDPRKDLSPWHKKTPFRGSRLVLPFSQPFPVFGADRGLKLIAVYSAKNNITSDSRAKPEVIQQRAGNGYERGAVNAERENIPMHGSSEINYPWLEIKRCTDSPIGYRSRDGFQRPE